MADTLLGIAAVIGSLGTAISSVGLMLLKFMPEDRGRHRNRIDDEDETDDDGRRMYRDTLSERRQRRGVRPHDDRDRPDRYDMLSIAWGC